MKIKNNRYIIEMIKPDDFIFSHIYKVTSNWFFVKSGATPNNQKVDEPAVTQEIIKVHL